MGIENISFKEAMEDGSYIKARKLLLESEDRSTRGYTMANAALAFSSSNCGEFSVEIKEAMEELLDSNRLGVLEPPLSEELEENIRIFAESKRHCNWLVYQGVGSILLAQVVTHGQKAGSVPQVGVC